MKKTNSKKMKKNIIEDVCVYGVSLISVAVIFKEIFIWMLYV